MAAAAKGEEDEALRQGRPSTPYPSVGEEEDPEAEVRAAERRRRPSRFLKVWLHVYDVDTVTARLNVHLKDRNMGVFHCGVEVLGDEWFFAWGDSDCSGVLRNEPRLHQVHIYRESVCMGESPLSEEEIRIVIGQAMGTWPANSYHPICRSCVSFAEELLRLLKVPEPFPAWARGAAEAAKGPVLLPVADAAWDWVKWYCAAPPEEPPAQEEVAQTPDGRPPPPAAVAGGAHCC